MTMLKNRGRRRVIALVAALAAAAVACGGLPVTVEVVFRKTSYFDGTSTREVVAVESGRVFANVTGGEIDYATVDPETIELGRSGDADRVEGRIESRSSALVAVSFPLTSIIQEPGSTEPAAVTLCIFFNAVNSSGNDIEANGCEDVLVPPANPRPQPPPASSGGGGSAPPTPSSQWRNITPSAGTAPSPRIQPAMAELPNGDVLLFGGAEQTPAGPAPVDDTWRFDGTTWTRLTPATSPPPRMGAAMAFNGTNVVLFGGSGGGVATSTWTWDNAIGNWADVSATAGTPPPARVGAAMAPIGSGGGAQAAFLFGGEDGGVLRDDEWLFNGSQWMNFSVAGPTGRSYPAMAFDYLNERVVLQGGDTDPDPAADSPSPETWLYSVGTGWIDVSGPEPGPREYAAMAVSDHDEPPVLYGGFNGAGLTDRTDLWTGSWLQVTTPGNPPPRSAPGMATFTNGGSFALMFGGHDSNGDFVAETWIYDPTP